MDFTDFTAGKDEQDRRLDKILKKILEKNPQSNPYSLLRKGLIKVNGKKADPSLKINQGDIIKIASFLLSQEPSSNSQNPNTDSDSSKELHLEGIETLFQNEHIMVINKPYGIPCQTSGTQKANLSTIFQEEFKKHIKTLTFVPGALHRLDTNTTGVLCFSKSHAGAVYFSQNIQTHNIRKTYNGIIQGHLENTQTWENSIENAEETNKSAFHKVKVLKNNGTNTAITIAKPLAYGKYKNIPITLVEFEIPTGKKHQIRSQSAFNHYPLLGDTAYGGTKIPECEYFLHAVKLEFPVPNPLNLPQIIEAPYPLKMKQFLNSFVE